jgi:S1-C subfamily serine protease
MVCRIIRLLRRLVSAAATIALMLLGSPAALAQQATGQGWLGVEVETLTKEAAEKKGAAADYGAVVVFVEDGSPLKGELVEGDLIISFNGKPVPAASDVTAALQGLPAGAKFTLIDMHGEQAKRLSVTLVETPALVEKAKAYPAAGDPLLRLETGGHQAKIKSLTFTPDGRFIVAAANDKLIRV